MTADHYQILELPHDANEREIKRAYYRLAKQLHPDKASDPASAKAAEERMALVSQAYNVLKDTQRRSEYDAALKSERPKANGAPPKSGTQPVKPVAAKVSAGSAAAARDRASEVAERRSQISEKALAKGLQLIKAGEADRAIEFLEAAVENNPENALAHVRLGQALSQCTKSLTRATESVQCGIELDPWKPDYHHTLADIYEQAGVKSRALEIHQKVLTWDQENALSRAKVRQLRGGGSSGGGFLARLLGRGG